MLETATFEDAAKLLADCGYEDMSAMSAREIDAALSARRQKLFDEITRMVPDSAVADIFRVKYDYHNAKALIKAQAMGQSAEHLLSASGRVAPEKLAEAFREQHYNGLPGKLGSVMESAKGVLARTANPQLADAELDKACFEELADLAAELDNPFIEGYIALLIDSTNLKSAVRTMKLNKGSVFMENVLLKGGNIAKDRILAAGTKEDLSALYARGKLAAAAVLGEDAIAGGPMTKFELACDNAVNSYLTGAALMGYGPETVATYLAAVEGETTAVRMILTGRLGGVKPAVIAERLRDLNA